MYEPGSWYEVGRRTAYERFGRAIVEVDFRLPSGRVETFSIRVEPSTVAVLASTASGDVLLTRQFRPGPGRFIYELPGGYLNDGEDAATGAVRELTEETGYTGHVEIIASCYSDSYSGARKYCGVARECIRVAEQRLDAEEFIEVVHVSVPTFRRLLRAGEVVDVDLAFLGLDALGLL